MTTRTMTVKQIVDAARVIYMKRVETHHVALDGGLHAGHDERHALAVMHVDEVIDLFGIAARTLTAKWQAFEFIVLKREENDE